MTRQEAKTSGSKFYNTGKPCLRGHNADRFTSSGVCVDCNRENVKANYYAKKQLAATNENDSVVS